MKILVINCFVLLSIVSFTIENKIKDENLHNTNVFLISTHHNKSTIEELLHKAEKESMSKEVTIEDSTGKPTVLKQTDFEKAIEIDDDTFGYGYALIVFFVVLLITIVGIKTLTTIKTNKEGASPDNCRDYLLFDLKDKDTDIGTVL